MAETELPSQEDFYSSLTEESISLEDYQLAQKIWDEFEIESIEGFIKLYVSVDTLILCDVMEEFRSMCRQDYGLEAFHFISLPGLSMMSCLKYTGVALDLFVDPDSYSFIEKGIR